MSYQDDFTLYHHKPCINGQASSGNPAIYTAYAVKLGLPVDNAKIAEAFQLIQKEKDGHTFLIRHPHKQNTSPISREEILGWVFLKLLKEEQVNGWSFSPFPLPKFSLIKLTHQLWKLFYIGRTVPSHKEVPSLRQIFGLYYGLKHRNYFWQNNLDQLYRFAFSVPLQDRHTILKSWGKFQWYNPVHVFYAAIAFVDSKLPKKSGIKWLKYGGEENLIEMSTEFPPDHPIRIKLGI